MPPRAAEREIIMKKILSVIAACAMLVTMTACGAKTNTACDKDIGRTWRFIGFGIHKE